MFSRWRVLNCTCTFCDCVFLAHPLPFHAVSQTATTLAGSWALEPHVSVPCLGELEGARTRAAKVSSRWPQNCPVAEHERWDSRKGQRRDATTEDVPGARDGGRGETEWSQAPAPAPIQAQTQAQTERHLLGNSVCWLHICSHHSFYCHDSLHSSHSV